MSYSPIEYSALFGVLGVRVQIPPDAQNGSLASVVRLVKIRRVKIPETVDAVGVQPAASKLFGSFGVSVQNRYFRKALRHNSFLTFKAKLQASHRQEPLILRITPQAIFVPECPDGWVVKSSG